MTATLLKHLQDSLSRDALAFLPELVLCGAIVLMLVLRLFPRFDNKHLGWVALVLTGYALIISMQQWFGGDASVDPRVDAKVESMNIFSGMLVFDNFTIFLRLFLLSFTFLVILLTLMTGIPDQEDSADFYCLLLGSVIGMSVMASANHLLMVLLGVEMASLPSYAMAGFLKGRRQSSEAALKYVVYGGAAAGVMLYGISLLAGSFGTAYLPELVARINHGNGWSDPMVMHRQPVHPHRRLLQAGSGAVPLLVPGRLRRGGGRGWGVSVGRFQGGGPGPASPGSCWAWAAWGRFSRRRTCGSRRSRTWCRSSPSWRP